MCAHAYYLNQLYNFQATRINQSEFQLRKHLITLQGVQQWLSGRA